MFYLSIDFLLAILKKVFVKLMRIILYFNYKIHSILYKIIIMTNLKTYFTTIISVLLLLILSGCQSVDVRGQFVSDSAIKQINSKKPNQEQLIDMIGTPTYVPDYSENTWYYIQRSLSRKAWFDPKVVQKRIVKITFAKFAERGYFC
jgi:sulfur relay (sulfurtransferase) DsrF/TusC family protein